MAPRFICRSIAPMFRVWEGMNRRKPVGKGKLRGAQGRGRQRRAGLSSRILHRLSDLASFWGVIWSSIREGEVGRACGDANQCIRRGHDFNPCAPIAERPETFGRFWDAEYICARCKGTVRRRYKPHKVRSFRRRDFGDGKDG